MNSSSNTSKNTSSIRDIEITTCCESSESALLLHHHHRGRQFCLSNLAASSSSSQLQIQSLDRTLACPCCGLRMPLHHDDQVAVTVNDLRGLPAGVKFDPTDVEILEHLEAKVCSDMAKIHPLIDRFIPTIKGDNGICYTHPEKLPGVSKDGQIRHFFHRPSKAYTTGTRKRRKVDSSTEEDPTGGGETRWHKTGKTRPVLVNGMLKGFKKILVLYANYGRQRKPEKTNWVMHQYHLGDQDEEKDGELVVSKVFYQTQPRQCGGQHAVAIRELPPPLQQRGDVDGSSTIVTYFHHQRQFISYHNQQHDINIPVVTSGSRDSDQSFPHELIPNNISGLQSSFISLDSACEHQQQQPKELR